ncbi:MAG: DNA repair protein RecN, partial [Clostridia bacterium]|nr:DNA repair protein RecN [Clostridia bacterium]
AGEPLKELGKIISGGEMSRFMLAIKAQLSSREEIGTYIFDEIDAGIGGRTARVVAEKFCNISRHVQLIAVSHLAQIAAFADREFLIEKREVNGRAQTFIREVKGEEQIAEIARLASGDDGDLALKHAEELLKNAKTYKNSLS